MFIQYTVWNCVTSASNLVIYKGAAHSSTVSVNDPHNSKNHGPGQGQGRGAPPSESAPDGPAPRLIFAWNFRNWGGAQIYLFSIIKNIPPEFDVRIVLPEGSDRQLLRFIDEMDVTRHLFTPSVPAAPDKGLAGRIRFRLGKIKSETAMLREIDRVLTDKCVVQVELGPWQSLLPLVWLCLRTNVFITVHNALPAVSPLRYLLWKIKLAAISNFRSFNALYSNRDSGEFYHRLFAKKARDRMTLAYTSVSARETGAALSAVIDRDALLTSYGLPADKFLVFCVGQFIDRKGRWTFIEAASRFHSERPDTVFVWIANSRPSDEDLEKASSFGIGDDLVFLTSEQVGGSRQDLYRLISCADLFALASTREGLSNSLLEAMALGVPVIATNVNALPEAVIHLETGWLIEAGDAKALAEALAALASDPGLRKRLAGAGKRHVLAHFEESEVADLVLDKYRKALEA